MADQPRSWASLLVRAFRAGWIDNERLWHCLLEGLRHPQPELIVDALLHELDVPSATQRAWRTAAQDELVVVLDEPAPP